MEPRYNEVLRDWQNLFAITRFRYIKVVFHIFYVLLGDDRSLYRSSTVTSDCYIIVCLNPYMGKMSQILNYDFLPEQASLLPTRDFARWS